MTSPLDAAIDSLRDNDRQWEAFQTQGHCVVIAPPGSGKTHLLSTRIASDLRDVVNRPHGAACITLTNPAVSELRGRIEALDIERRSTVFVGTVHSFALSQIVRPYARLTSYSHLAERSIASYAETNACWKQAIVAIYGPSDSTRFVRSTVEYYRKKMVPEASWNDEKLVRVANLQRQLMVDAGIVELDEIVEGAVELVAGSSTIRSVLSSRFPRIYVDEYQDLAPGLDLLVRTLCLQEASASTLFAVGDPDQAIYGWTGSRADPLFDLAAVDDVESVHLKKNYRCGSEIIRAANYLRPVGSVEIEGDEGGSISARRVDGLIPGQADAAADKIVSLAEAGTELHHIAVLCLTNDDCRDAARVLETRDVPHFVRLDDYRQTPATMLIESLACWATFGRELSGHRLGDLLSRLRLLTGQRNNLREETALVGVALRAESDGSAAEFVIDLLDTGLVDRIAGQENSDADEVSRMLDSLESGSLADATVQELGARARKSGRVEVTTMSSSKGLEFDAVIMLGADQDRIPHYYSRGVPEKLEEDKRKFYVSVTRARHTVLILYSGYAFTKYGRRVECGPSDFLRLMQLV